MDWAQILVIILSSFLALFLLLAIILVVLLIRVTQQIRSVTESAKRTAGSIESIVAGAQKFSSPALVMSMVAKQMKNMKKSKKKED